MRKLSLWTLVLVSALFCVPFLFGQTRGSSGPDFLPGGHRGAVTALLRDAQGNIFSAGEDGFMELWNGQAAVERYQLSSYGIKSMVLRPGKPQVAVVESDGLGLYRISAWDYAAKKNLFTLRFRDSISYINYSAAGNFLIVARSGRTGAAFIHPETGEVLESPGDLSGPIAFAATGRSERVMICYLSSGILSYWDLESGSEVQHFDVPSNIQSPVLFGNNRFLGGFDSQGLVVLDAVEGTILARDITLTRGIFFIDTPDTAAAGRTIQFSCLSSSGGVSTVSRLEMSMTGWLTVLSRRTLPASAGAISAAVSGNADSVFLGTTGGSVWALGRNSARLLNTGFPEQISDAAASSSALAFLSEKGALGYIPLDYSRLTQNQTLILENAGAYTGILSDPSENPASGESRFLLWQPGAGRSIPLIKTLRGPPAEALSQDLFLDTLAIRFPLRSAAVMGNSILFLDTAGSISVLDRDTRELRFTYTASGSVDAAFIDPNTIILGRSAVSGNTPFMTVNIQTGETVSLAYPGMVGVRVYRGGSGTIYGAVADQAGSNIQTSIIRLNVSNPSRSERLLEYGGEDSSFTMAESGRNIASTLGDGAATLYIAASSGRQNNTPEITAMERGIGLPVKIIDGGRWFIILDGDGGITWHDSRSGKLLAGFRLYQDYWVLERNGQTVWGRTAGK